VPDRFGPFSRIPRIPVMYPRNIGIKIGLNLTGCGIGVSLGHQGLSFYGGDLRFAGPSIHASKGAGGYSTCTWGTHRSRYIPLGFYPPYSFPRQQ